MPTRKPRLLRPHKRTSNALVVSTLCLLCTGYNATAAAQGQANTNRPSSTAPTDSTTSPPLRNYSLFRDDEIFIQIADKHPINQLVHLNTQGGELHRWQIEQSQTSKKDQFPIASAAGRLGHPDRDEVVVMHGTIKHTSIETHPSRVAFAFPALGGLIGNQALVVADLDGIADEDGHFFDEVVVIFNVVSTNSDNFLVTIFDRNLKPTGGHGFQNETILKAIAGDLDGDGRQELLLVSRGDAKEEVRLTAYNLIDNNLVLDKRWTVRKPTPNSDLADLLATDLDGDNRDELVVAYTASSTAPLVSIYAFDQHAGELTKKANAEIGCRSVIQSKVGLTAGPLRFDPLAGYGLHRTQLSTGAITSCGLEMKVFDFSTGGVLTETGHIRRSEEDRTHSEQLRIVAGNFRGHAGESPAMDVVTVRTGFSKQALFDAFEITQAGAIVHSGQQRIPLVDEWPQGMVMSAWDRDGDSLYLGAPAHFTINDVLRTDFVIQEPPKHVDFIEGEIVNVSRRRAFNVELIDRANQSFATRTTSQSDWTIGGSTDVSASKTVSADSMIVKATASVSAKLKLGYGYDSKKSDYEANQGSRTVSTSSKTESDDWIMATVRPIDIWRYRIFGTTVRDATNRELNGYYEIVLPGVPIEVRQGGLQTDGYQPIHENGNVLSYPSGREWPTDLGHFTLSDGTTKREPMISPKSLTWGGTSERIALEYTDGSDAGNTRNYSHRLTQNADLRMSFEVETKLFVKAKTRVEGGVSFNNGNSWGEAKVANSATSTTRGITLSKSSGDANHAYTFSPTFYITEDGTVKVAHTVALQTRGSSGLAWWARHYGRKPDLAFNLPLKFRNSGLDDTWTANTAPERNRMRGFFLLGPRDFQGNNTPLGRAPVEGDPIIVAVRVYNYSIGQAIPNADIRFEAVRYDDSSDTESGPRRLIGTTRIANLSPLEMREARIDWDTKGWGPGKDGLAITYRIYAILDPENRIDEIHESDGPGANNIGFGLATISGQDRSLPLDLFLQDDALALATVSNSALSTDNARVISGQPTRLRIHVQADQVSRSPYHLLVSDSLARKGELIALKRIAAIDRDGTYVWVDWTPTTAGQHRLLATVIERADDASPGNAIDELLVTVEEP